MGYMLLYVIQGSDSVSGPYIRRGAHPPPHRHRPRVQAKLTHNHATGFPRRPCRGSFLRRPLRWRPASRPWLARSNVSQSVDERDWSNWAAIFFFSLFLFAYAKRGGHSFEEGRKKIQFHNDFCVLVAHKEESRREWMYSGNNLTQRADPYLHSFGKCSLLNSDAVELIWIR